MALLLDAESLARVLMRMAHQIAEKNANMEDVVLAGIRTRGVPLAERIAANLGRIEGVRPPVIAIDIEPYRDDREHPKRRASWISEITLADRVVVLVDDVLYTGRTVRAALDATVDQGRPRAVQLAVLVDRGHRELPIRADFVGKNIPTARSEIVRVNLMEVDGVDAVTLEKEGTED
ncbi:bifunctional pyr operon transcriptional regulator/uracil phosphoribosyltransferase PyrR [Sulfobacillus harzensis]|uniref:bifunctional pyr operon transcriptional regulator/uracil phosphoribosyltransferase PyrR n=1 Tax=Sulfobacillus harzensis TaxID=2729629 RepID=UPI003B8376B8